MKRFAAIIVLGFACAAAFAQESRTIRPIARPPAPAMQFAPSPPPPQGSRSVANPRPVLREHVEEAVRKLLQAWNERKLDLVLGQSFRDRQRLIDTLQSRVPRDARLRLIALQSWQVVNQYERDDKPGIAYSQISVTVRTQLEYNDPTMGFQRREGTNDLIVTLGERGD